jgi:hypothetical protein
MRTSPITSGGKTTNNPPIERAKEAIPIDSGLRSRATRYIAKAVATLLTAA